MLAACFGVALAGCVTIAGLDDLTFRDGAAGGGGGGQSTGVGGTGGMAPAYRLEWFRTFGGTGDDAVHGLAVDGAGAVYLAGTFRDDFQMRPTVADDFDPAPLADGSPSEDDAFVLRLDPADGSVRWAQQMVTTGSMLEWAEAADLTLGWGSVSVVGSQQIVDEEVSGFLQNFDADTGAPGHAEHFAAEPSMDPQNPTHPVHARSVAFDGGSNLLVAGTFGSSLVLPGTTLPAYSDNDVFLVDFDQSFNMPYAPHVYRFNASDGVEVTIAGPNPWIAASGSGAFGLASCQPANPGVPYGFVLSVNDPCGSLTLGNGLRFTDILAAPHPGGNGEDVWLTAAALPNQDVSLDGTFIASPVNADDGFAAKMPPKGAGPFSGFHFGAAQTDSLEAVHLESATRALVAGTCTGTMTIGGQTVTCNGNDALVALLEDDGSQLAPIDLVTFGGAGSQVAADVARMPDGSILVVGTFGDAIDFAPYGSGAAADLQSRGGTDVFVAKLTRP